MASSNDQFHTFLINAKIAYPGPTKGTILLAPNGCEMWNNIVSYFSKYFQSQNFKEVKLPSIFPVHLFKKEQDHFSGFNPELFTIDGDSNPQLLRPTSEILFCQLFRNLIYSYRDLPFVAYQWGSVFRKEYNTKMLFRTTEFWWHEGHSLHTNNKEAILFCQSILDLYKNCMMTVGCLFPLCGLKTDHEKFAGAKQTWTTEVFIKDEVAIQVATSHFLGTNFSKQFDVVYFSNTGKKTYPQQTSWGLSSRFLGVVLAAHMDNYGFCLPTKIAIYQIIIFNLSNCDAIKNDLIKLEKLNIQYKNHNLKSFNQKLFQFYTTLGIPLIAVIRKNGKITLFIRTNPSQPKTLPSLSDLCTNINQILLEFDRVLFKNHKDFVLSQTYTWKEGDIFKNIANQKALIIGPFKCTSENENNLQQKHSLTVRCIIKPLITNTTKCIFSKDFATHLVYLSRSY